MAVVLTNNSGVAATLGAFNFEVHDGDTTLLNPVPGLDLNLDGNPDFNQADIAGPWSCDPPAPAADTGSDGPGKAVSLLSCFNPTGAPPNATGPGGSQTLARVHYAVPLGVHAGSAPLRLGFVAVYDGPLNELGSCAPEIDVAATCAGATVTLGSPSPPAVCGDVNGDGNIDALDLLLIARHMGKSAYDAKYDLNHDGRVNAIDLLIAAKQRGKRCPQAEALAAFG